MDDESGASDELLTTNAAAPAEADAGGQTPPREPPTLETVLVWLARVKPAAVLAVLRDPRFALASTTAFAGFRVNATGYANPLVRRRLAQEAVRDEKFADKLRDLATVPAAPLSTFATLSTGTPEDPPPDGEEGRRQNAAAASPTVEDTGQGAETRVAALKAERDRRRRERDEARQALSEAEAGRQEAERRRLQAEAERDEAHRQAQRQAQRIARLERQVTKLQTEQASLLRALRQREEASVAKGEAESAASPAPPSSADPVDLRSNPWQAAVAHLLDKRRFDLALSLAEDVLRAEPDNPDALDIAARGQGAKGETREAAALLRRRLAVILARGERGAAGDVFLRLLLLTPSDAERDLRAFLGGLRADDAPAVEQARALLARLRGVAPETHTVVAAAISRLTPRALAEMLIPPPGLIGPDDPLPLGMTGNVTARQILRAVDTGHVDLVEGARTALARLGHADAETQERVRQALERAAGEDASVLVPLLGTGGRGAAVVDGSNAAWFDQESLAAGRPRLRPLRELRRVLRARGYFPVLLYADAPLPYTIDEPDALRAMAAHGELTLVDSGVDADEVLLREARRFGAPLITNDYMTDWDPNNEVPKIRFTVSLSGEAYLLNEQR